MVQVSVTQELIRVSAYGEVKHVRFVGTRMGADFGKRRTTCQLAVRWATLTGSSEDLARAAWRKAGIGAPRYPSKITEPQWEELLGRLDAEISDLVNNPSSKFYIYG